MIQPPWAEAGSIGLGRLAVAMRLPVGQILLYIGFFLFCLVVGGGAIHLLRRYLKNPERKPSGPVLTLNEVRAMRERGEITEKEFERLKHVVLSRSEAASRSAEDGSEV